MNDKLYIGHIASFFGLKGEVKIVSNNNHLDKIFKVGNKIFIEDEEHIINTFRLHKKNVLISLKGYEHINLIERFLKKNVYINRKDLLLSSNEYLYSDLLNNKVIYNNKELGIVSEVLINKINPLIKVNNIIIPLSEKYLEKIDIKNKIIYVKDIRELII